MFGGDPRDLQRYFALSQVGLEMVAPIGIGLLIDYCFNWLPWATVVCSILGFVGGMTHLVLLATKYNAEERRRPPGGTP